MVEIGCGIAISDSVLWPAGAFLRVEGLWYFTEGVSPSYAERTLLCPTKVQSLGLLSKLFPTPG